MNKRQIKLEKEMELLAEICMEPDNYNKIFEKISLDMLSEEHKEIFQGISELNPVNESGIVWEMKKRDYTYFQDVMDKRYSIVSDIGNRIKQFFDIHDSIVADKLLFSELEKSKTNLMGLQTLCDLKEKIDLTLNKYDRFQKTLTFNETIAEIIDRVEQRVYSSDSVKTKNFPSFNAATGGLREGNYVGIAGAYKNGKTTFGLNLILDLAGQDIPTAIFSLEMSKSEIEEKILSYKTNIAYEKIREPRKMNQDEILTLARFKSASKRNNEKLFLYDRRFTISDIEATVRGLCKKEKVKVIFIDYLNLILNNSKRNESREREISQLSSSLKILAKETNTIIFILSQLNRTGIKEPGSINLAESIGLARDCDFLFTISKPDMIKMQQGILNNERHFEVILDTSRHTQSGKKFLLELTDNGYMKEMATYYDLAYLETVKGHIETKTG